MGMTIGRRTAGPISNGGSREVSVDKRSPQLTQLNSGWKRMYLYRSRHHTER
jgi:hypothetical protein